MHTFHVQRPLEPWIVYRSRSSPAVATAMGIRIKDGVVTAEGDIDFRGTLGVDQKAPVGLKAIRLRFDLDTDADAGQLAALIRLTERY